VLNILVSEVSLQGSRIMPLVGQREAAGVPQHVRVDLEAKPGHLTSPLDHPGKSRRGEGRSALRGEHERRFGVLLTLQLPQRPHFIADNRMRGRGALLDPADVQDSAGEIDLVPTQVDQFAGSEAVPVGTSTMVASRCPQRLLLAALISFSISASVRCSRVRSSALGRRRGVTVRFTVAGVINRRGDFFNVFRPG
jgi:hypothetical protein